MRFEMRWNPPSCLLLEIGATMPGHAKTEGVTARVSHLLTPETETSTHYFWAFARNSKLKDQILSAQLREGISQAFMSEDAPIIEWQQRYDALLGQVPMRRQTLPGDAGGARARRIVERLREAEQRRHVS
jgi:vanillate O-demethylase monooxygenase subunit